jgi:hypothetical protein
VNIIMRSGTEEAISLLEYPNPISSKYYFMK